MLTRLSDPQEIQDAWDRTTIDPSRPVLVGVGPVDVATTHALELYPSIIFDTNLFYRDLGVAYRATRVEIRRAYIESGGPNSPRLTMISKVLLSPERRAAYDRTPLGHLFFDDEIEEAMRIAAATAAGEARAEGEEVDSEALNRHLEDMRQPADEMNDLPAYTNRYPWSYYLLGSNSVDTELLTTWRTSILINLWNLVDRPRSFAVGFMSGTNAPFRFVQVGTRMVCLMDDQLEFSESEASKAAQIIYQQTSQ